MNGLVFVSNQTGVSRLPQNITNPIVMKKGFQQITVPADKPCVVGFVNYNKQDLQLNFNNQNVSAYLFTLKYPNQTQLTPLG
jgi:hypothetical protein